MPDARLTVTLRNEREEITRLLSHIEAFAAEAGIDDESLNALMLCVDEAVANTISHGFPDGGSHDITVRLMREGPICTAEIEDDGEAFDPTQAPNPDLTLTIEERGIGGLGIHLMRVYMDDLQYRREGGRNILTLTKNLDTQG